MVELKKAQMLKFTQLVLCLWFVFVMGFRVIIYEPCIIMLMLSKACHSPQTLKSVTQIMH